MVRAVAIQPSNTETTSTTCTMVTSTIKTKTEPWKSMSYRSMPRILKVAAIKPLIRTGMSMAPVVDTRRSNTGIMSTISSMGASTTRTATTATTTGRSRSSNKKGRAVFGTPLRVFSLTDS